MSIEPIREAQREWEKAKTYLDSCLANYRATRQAGWSVGAAVQLADALDEERTLHETYEALLIDEMAAEIGRR